MRSHNGWGGKRNTLYKGVEISLYHTYFKNLEGKPERESPKRTISASGGLEQLQMISEPDTKRCASEKAESRRGVDTRQCASKDTGPRRGVDWGIPHRLEKGTSAGERTLGLKGGRL